MFERYTEKALGTIFFARDAASQFGSPKIEPEHLLLGLLHESKPLPEGSQRPDISWALLVRHKELIRKQIEVHATIRAPVPTSVDMLLSNECQRVLAYAAQEAERLSHKHIGEAERLSHKHIGIEHLLLGLLREQDCFATKVLNERGVLLESARAQIENRL